MPEVPFAEWSRFLIELWWRFWAFWTEHSESVRNLFVIVGGLVGLGLLWWRTSSIHRQAAAALQQAEIAQQQAATAERRHEAQVEADRERRITDNFTRAIEQLGSDKLETRLGAIYALERIARESSTDHWPIMETLTAFVREWAPWPPVRRVDEKGELGPAIDVQAVLTVIGRRCRKHEHASQRLDLGGTDLRGCRLISPHLENVSFIDTHLENAGLYDASLQGAVFYNAHLEAAKLAGARLEGAVFFDAHLEGAWFGASDLTQEQFDSAITDENTHVPPRIETEKAGRQGSRNLARSDGDPQQGRQP